jgi:hypothetical protein
MTDTTKGTKTLCLLLLAGFVAGLAVVAVAPGAAAASCSNPGGNYHSDGPGGCSAGCNWFGCDGHAWDYQNN